MIGVGASTATTGSATAVASAGVLVVASATTVAVGRTGSGADGTPSSAAKTNEATSGSRPRRIAARTSTPDNLSTGTHG